MKADNVGREVDGRVCMWSRIFHTDETESMNADVILVHMCATCNSARPIPKYMGFQPRFPHPVPKPHPTPTTIELMPMKDQLQ